MLTNELSDALFSIGAIKTGNFVLKSGLNSPIYIDLRTMISFPKLLEKIAKSLQLKVQSYDFQLVCGVPYTAIPLATAFSLLSGCPMVMRRKELKAHGTKKLIEGVFEPGQKVLVIEDIVTSGTSILETIHVLEEAGLEVSDAICIIDREQGATEYLRKNGYALHSLYHLSGILDALGSQDKINKEKILEIKGFIKSHPFQEP